MKRIALLLAAVGLGSGCVIETTGNTGDAVLYWSFWNSDLLRDFGSATATATEVCAAAAVDEIEITLTDPARYVRAPVSGPCVTGNDVPGALFVDLQAGTWDYYIAGYRGGVLVFDDWGSFDVYDRDRTLVDSTMTAIYWDLRIDYATETCVAGDTIEFDLCDTRYVDPVYSTWRGTTNPPVAVPCSTAGATMYLPSVPPGPYAFSRLVQVDALGEEVGWSTCSPTWTQPATTSKAVTVSIVDSIPPSPTAPNSARAGPQAP